MPALGLPPSGARAPRGRGSWGAAPGAHVSTSHETAGVFREYERCATTVVDAALSPLTGGYLRELERRCADAGLPEPEVMLSSGGAADLGHRGAARSLDGALGPGRVERWAAPGWPRWPAPATLWDSTWAARRATCRWRSRAAPP